LRFYGTNLTIASNNRRCAVTIRQSHGDANAHAVADSNAVS
jgi:hypothetical protein